MKKMTGIEKIKIQFGKDIQHVVVKNDLRVTMTVNGDKIVEIADYLFRVMQWRFIIASALDTREGIEILYHFSHDQSGMILNIRVVLDRENTEIESLTCLFEGANWIEREMHEIMGINFLHHPNLEKLISEGNWAEGVYPYRKEGLRD
ncbi:MAG: NADH-quinone oxidoreductase subunit C [Bacteroidales bacterium]|nr:NADH-quinone oxidoreductase subunit C [Bacteroidales bacterium]